MLSHRVDGGEFDHYLAASSGSLIIFAEPSVLAKPRKCSLNHPALRGPFESVLLLFTLDDPK